MLRPRIELQAVTWCVYIATIGQQELAINPIASSANQFVFCLEKFHVRIAKSVLRVVFIAEQLPSDKTMTINSVLSLFIFQDKLELRSSQFGGIEQTNAKRRFLLTCKL
jgi:hypothetical protein